MKIIYYSCLDNNLKGCNRRLTIDKWFEEFCKAYPRKEISEIDYYFAFESWHYDNLQYKIMS